MACAGLILARHNNITPDDEVPKGKSNYESIAGLSPECTRLGIRLLSANSGIESAYHIGEAIDSAWKKGADVINNCWTWYGGYSSYIDEAIDSALANGREGLGTIIIFSSGNKYWNYDTIFWPKTKDNVLAVGAIGQNDNILSSCCIGEALDLVAPSNIGDAAGIWSIDREDSLGNNPYQYSNCQPYNDIDYLCSFGKTSAAAPLVTGTAALLLSRRPDLTAQEVMDVLKYSAVTDLDWGTVTPPDTAYGYGRVNALRAMLAITRGDANNDGTINIGDVVRINAYIYQGVPPEPHPLTGDANCDGSVNTADIIYLNNYIYKGGPAPPICFEY